MTNILRKNLLKIVAIAAFCAVFDVIIHAWLPIHEYPSPSLLVKNNLFKPVAAGYLFLLYLILGIIFTIIQEKLSGNKIQKGLNFAISFGGLWLLGVLGMNLFFDSPLSYELITGGLDFLAVILMGVLLGKYVASDNPNVKIQKISKQTFWLFFFITIVYIVGRYFASTVFNIQLPYETKLFETLLWTFGIGFWMGLSYFLLKQSVSSYSPLKKATVFSGLIFGIFWILFNFFALLLVETSILVLLLFIILDVLLLGIGIWFFEIKIAKNLHLG